ncbi:alpha/beta fold hydrolase [Pseudescherichia vulneris]|uniref:alpha/beta hydrolase family protein n=1 Tax=Pseudescherichia vulneris TaxID=566 RepID=UPI00227C525D|nr:alpha/beta fold hydrolase [Pseudescherichia vulneris]WAH52790.1 alpha/beta fold hydrolase [Pseudescherichia vulneris]
MNLITIPVKEGGVLASTMWERSDAKALVIVHPATAVSQDFYKGFAEYLYEMGFTVLTYDYRGTGQSTSETLRNCHISMSDWIEQDVGCVTAWAKLRFPHLLIMAVGHSVGGHAILLSTATHSLHAGVIVASHAGVTRTIKQTGERLRVWFLLRVLAPVLCRIFGYMPARRLGLGENLPAPVMNQWGRWSAMPNYFYDDPGWDARRRVGEITLPLLVLGFDDDPWANPDAITRLMAPVKNANVERREIRHRDVGSKAIGHMGFFRSRYRETLWPEVGNWLLRQRPD